MRALLSQDLLKIKRSVIFQSLSHNGCKSETRKKIAKNLSFGQNLAQYLFSYTSGSFAKVFSLKRQRMKKLK